MPSFASKTLLSALAAAASVAAHGHVNNIVINGLKYDGYNPFTFPYMQNPPKVAGWTASNTDNGFVAPDAFASGDIICHKAATNARAHAVVAAGDKISLQWDTWAESHRGPVIDYLANCGTAGCETVDKTSLEFFKISEVGLVDGSKAPGVWGSDQLRANNNTWLVQIPSHIAPGFYVLRHEIIALHSGFQANGAQNYPQCFSLQVTGSGTEKPAGVRGTSLYTPTDPGILANIYNNPLTYKIPGPALISGASAVPQSSSVITGTTTAITGSASALPAATTKAVSAATTPAVSATSTKAASAPTTPAGSATPTAAPSATSAPAATSSAASPSSTTHSKPHHSKPPRPTGCAGQTNAHHARRHARDLVKN